jgi:hypothetical protein
MTNRAHCMAGFYLLATIVLVSACSAGLPNGKNDAGNGGATSSATTAAGGSAVTATGGASVGTGGASLGTGGGSGGVVKGTGGAGTGGASIGVGGGSGGGASGGSYGGAGKTGSAGCSGCNEGGAIGRGGTAGGRSGTGGLPATGGRSGTGGQVGGQPGTGGAAGGSTGATACASTLPAITDYTVLAGPFATTTEANTGPDGKCVIYRPKTLGENGFLHAPIVFGPGIGMQASQLSGLLLSFASHGYVVIGTGVLNGGPNDPANKSQMTNALDWIIKQNTQAGTYQGKLATKCAISMGYSVGGTAAVEVGGHEAVATTVSIHGHVANSAMHGPLLQTSGDKDTVGRPMQQQTFDKSQVQTAFGTVSGADHGYIQSNNGGVERHAIIAWMRYWINGDTGARSYFWGSDCVLCKSPWMDYKTKNWK